MNQSALIRDDPRGRDMAKSGAKKRLEENRAKLKFLSDVLNGAMALHVVVRVVFRWKSVRLFHLCVFAVTALACRASLGSLRAYPKPTFGENGEVLDGGESLSGGLTEYYQDLIYVGAFAMATSTYSDRFWLVTLIVPLVAGYMIVTKFVLPYVFAPRAEENEEREETKEEKRRRERSERRKAKRFR